MYLLEKFTDQLILLLNITTMDHSVFRQKSRIGNNPLICFKYLNFLYCFRVTVLQCEFSVGRRRVEQIKFSSKLYYINLRTHFHYVIDMA